ncbi:hypothetical protein BU26DRAFT_531051 [Trematosphaeria pertusa]|uniref:Uncharacterized protein n=1 Tax=Trematosphaeria pertusa TaxID=390896 RepID=A0A6A6IER3_9PLEO|nr:uncharacterized protein BU26DRAFT_531051 [Trematosphaeria pertusa]KAF2249074.1 hypothetical protein BU26DRAFT_531051 [Trematosphaeria pertusa]
MVSTRQHPREFPPPEASPTKGSPRKSSRNSTASPAPGSPDLTSSPTSKSLTRRAVSNSIAASSSSSSAPGAWAHTASNITILWVTFSLPLVIWDAIYILARPHTMAGGAIQWPLWKPYEIYASIDYVYGWPGWNDNNGFAAAQGVLNAIECVLYGLYIMIIFNHGVAAPGGTGLQVGRGLRGWIAGGMKVEGKTGNRALVIGFSAALMTFSKTLLYYLTEYYSGFENTKHNDWITLVLFYGVMNGCWLVFPAYMTFTFGSDLLNGLDAATESSSKKKN